MIIVLQQKEHDLFIRERNNLFIKHTVGLTEALCGFKFVLKHMDGRSIVIQSQPGDILEPGAPFSMFGLGKRRDRRLLFLT